MEIVTRFNGENRPLVDILNKVNIYAELAQDCVVAWIPYKKENGGVKIYDLNLPYSALEPKTLYLRCSENGGAGRSKEGDSSVICSINGEKLTPYQIIGQLNPLPDGPKELNKLIDYRIQAYFLVPSAVAIVTAYRDRNIKIQEYRIIRKGTKAWINTKELWCNKLGRLPDRLRYFHQAVLAASDKSNCGLCNHIHYAVKSVASLMAS